MMDGWYLIILHDLEQLYFYGTQNHDLFEEACKASHLATWFNFHMQDVKNINLQNVLILDYVTGLMD
jgi:hypothetical protein